MRVINNSKGLTLLELLAVIVIFSVVLLIAVSSVITVIHNTEDKSVLSDIVALIDTAKMAYADGSCNVNMKCTLGRDGDIEFKSSKIIKATIDFSNGTTPDKSTIEVDLFPFEFKGRLKQDIIQLFGNQPFTERELLDLMNIK